MLHPSWWRENLGFTHSKFIYDARAGFAAPLPQGINVVLTNGHAAPLAEGVVHVAVLEDYTTPVPADVRLWQPPVQATDEECIAALVVLETHVMHGAYVAYGLADFTLGSPTQRRSLQAWLGFAERAAEHVWGRKKRPALRALLVSFDVMATAPLFYPSSENKGQSVPLLEHAAQLGLWVMAEPCWPTHETAQTKALQTLARVAEAEIAVHQALQGQWPHISGKPLFAVLPFLQRGAAPWQHPTEARVWRHTVWPMLVQAFIGVAPQLPVAIYTAWQEAWACLVPQLEDLAACAATTRIEACIVQQAQALPADLKQHPLTLQHGAVCAAVPGIGGVVVPPLLACALLHSLPDIADIGPFFAH
jgi:hypothetical protein